MGGRVCYVRLRVGVCDDLWTLLFVGLSVLVCASLRACLSKRESPYILYMCVGVRARVSIL